MEISPISDLGHLRYNTNILIIIIKSKIIGWDLTAGDDPINYWIAANTFSDNWGLSGYVKINMDEIDDLI